MEENFSGVDEQVAAAEINGDVGSINEGLDSSTSEESNAAEAATPHQSASPTASPQGEAFGGTQEGNDEEQRWNDVLADEGLNRRIQEIVGKRVSGLKGKLESLYPALEILGHSYGMDVADMADFDFKEFAKRVTEDDSYFAKAAEDLVPDAGLARRLFNSELKAKREGIEAEKSQLREHYDGLTRQGYEFGAKHPGFSLTEEMRNPVFANMVGPAMGLSVEQAYNAVHFEEILDRRVKDAVAEATNAVTRSVRAGRSFPEENGQVSSPQNGYGGKMYSQMSPTEKAAYEKLLLEGRIKY